MGTMLDEVVRYHKPGTWDDVSYDRQRYIKVQVFGDEHGKVIEEFTPELRTRVQLIYRVQNPYIYGRYRLKVEQMQLTGKVYEERWYHPIAEDDMNVVMEYNCDYRRYMQATYGQYSGKQPRFYKTAEHAISKLSAHSNKALVAVKAVSTNISVTSECCKEWDTEYYPEYIIVLHD